MADPKLTEKALDALLGAIPFALNGATLTVTYPSLDEYAARAQSDLTALAKLRPVRASSVDMPTQSPPSGPQVLTVTFL